MSATVISVEDIAKRFTLAHARPRSLADAARGRLRRVREEFWALKGVSFSVEQGEALGIIGHNGAGKSTMLKLLTGIMAPTKGRLRTRGRISALIEVGAGFHPEMTGRENIYLNGAILGMKRREIDHKLDDIVAFANLEQFIDTPVKRYSSGMYARLGFSVAAHVDPEILLVDEVLSVGDAAFQGRCAERMRQVKLQGTTIVFVSHNFGAVTSICDRAIGLWKGEVFVDAAPPEAIASYRDMIAGADAAAGGGSATASGGVDEESDLVITRVESVSPAGEWQAYTGSPWTLRIHYTARRDLLSPEIACRISNGEGAVIAQPCTIDYGQARDIAEGEGVVEFAVDSLPLIPGRYGIEAFAWDATGIAAYDYGRHSYNLIVRNSDAPIEGTGVRFGLIKMPGEWVWPDSEGV